MTETAFVYPGQGSQRPGMLDSFYDAWPGVESELESVATEEVKSLLFDADETALQKTENTQKTVFTASLVVGNVLSDRYALTPDIVAGHSLGGITAATTAGVLDPDVALSLVERRGRLMADAERAAGPGTMKAVLLADPETITDVVESCDDVSVAAYNSDRQTVISGRTDAVETAADRIAELADRSRMVDLDVDSGFHSPVMEPAVEPFTEFLSELTFANPTVPVVSDVTGETYDRGAAARQSFSDQLTSPVRWNSVVGTLREWSVDRIVVLPPTGELSSIVENLTANDDVDVITIDSPRSAEEVFADG